MMSYNVETGGIRLPEQSAAERSTQVGSSHHFTGQIVIGDGVGRLLRTESHLEMKAALILAVRPETAELFEQIAFEWTDADGTRRVHYIDLVVQQKDGRWIGYAVRPAARVCPTYLKKLARIKAQAQANGFLWDFRLFSDEDVDPDELFNARLLHSVRVPEPNADAIARKVISGARGVVTIGSLVAETGLEGHGFRAVVRQIRSRNLHAVRRERINYATEVFRADPAATPLP